MLEAKDTSASALQKKKKKVFTNAASFSRILFVIISGVLKPSDIIKNHVGKLLVVPNVTRWNLVYDGVTCLLFTCDSNKAGLLNACRKLEMRFFTASSSFALQ